MATARIRAGDIHMHYELSGPPGAPVVCLNHCFCADYRYWDMHMAAFEGFRVLRFDTRGHGETDATSGPYSLTLLADDVAHLCDALGIGNVHLVGVSLGGQIAQTFALRQAGRVDSLILVNTTCEYTVSQRQMWRERADEAIRVGMGALAHPLLSRWFTASAEAARIDGYRYMARRLEQMQPESFAAAAVAMCDLDTTARLAEITVPSMVIATPDDPGAPREVSEKMARLIGECELHWLEPAQHLASLEHPQRFNALVSDFLARRARGAVSGAMT